MEELWQISIADYERTEVKKGMKPFCIALEELGREHLLVPLGRSGVLQMSVVKNSRIYLKESFLKKC